LPIFAVIATLPFIVIVEYELSDGRQKNIQIWKERLIKRNKLIMAIVPGVLALTSRESEVVII
jgi:hypothetical protein